MRVLITGATGMIGSGVLIECLESDFVESVLIVGRRSCGKQHPKITEILHRDFLDFSPLERELTGLDACFYCLGVKVGMMREANYRRITVEYAAALGAILVRRSPGLAMCFLSGEGVDPTRPSRLMWVRVKGEAEQLMSTLPFERLHIFRPGYIHPEKGVRPSYFIYQFSDLFYPLLRLLMPRWVCTTSQIGRAMIAAALGKSDRQILSSRDIVQLSAAMEACR
ncbi:MAG: NAD-dependent epimerase/dehydratase family protein [Calditrichaeota bacterium]|nr:NAD-dependent epimerase/dehydratase family protein [Calditrichota bacterium]